MVQKAPLLTFVPGTCRFWFVGVSRLKLGLPLQARTPVNGRWPCLSVNFLSKACPWDSKYVFYLAAAGKPVTLQHRRVKLQLLFFAATWPIRRAQPAAGSARRSIRPPQRWRRAPCPACEPAHTQDVGPGASAARASLSPFFSLRTAARRGLAGKCAALARPARWWAPEGPPLPPVRPRWPPCAASNGRPGPAQPWSADGGNVCWQEPPRPRDWV